MTRDNQRTESTRESETRLAYDFETFTEVDPTALPDSVVQRFADQGMVLRWIRISLKGQDDIKNVSKRHQDGWEFVTADEVEELAQSSFIKEEGRYAGVVCRGDVALAKMDARRAESRKRYFENKNAQQMDAVNAQLMKHQDSRAPISNSSKSTVTTGRQPRFQD